MKGTSKKAIQAVVDSIMKRDPNQPEFLQASTEILHSIEPVLDKRPEFIEILDRIVEPERVIHFRVPWLDSKNQVQVNRGFRVQFNSAIGPFKGGLRFHPSVNLSIMKFLGFEQIFKNALTGLPMGGSKGGSDFDPLNKTENEVMRFCQSFMIELSKHIGPNLDVPAGDIGVGGREVGYLFGQYKRIKDEFTGTITGKGYEYGGSLLRPEATGYGLVWFVQEMLKEYKKGDLEGKKCIVSGAGNVATYCAEQLTNYGAKVFTLGDFTGTIYEPDGFTKQQLEILKDITNNQRKTVKEYLSHSKTVKYLEGQRPWKHIKADIALPCATQNEINIEDAKAMKENGIFMVAEGANMPSTSDAIDFYHSANMIYGPSKACNAGGVACSGLEMAQNSIRQYWSKERVEQELHQIMINIFRQCYQTSEQFGQPGNLQLGANAAGFMKVANAMLMEGCV